MSESFTVTAWNNGDHSKTGSGYGLKISIDDRDNYFKKSAKSVVLHLSGKSGTISVNTDKPSFWSPLCRELVSKDIGAWLIANKMGKWARGSPPKLTMVSLGNNVFRLKK